MRFIWLLRTHRQQLKVRPIHPLLAAILGFALAPLLPALILILVFLFVEQVPISLRESALEYYAIWVMAYYTFAELFAIFIGIPMLFAMRYFWKITLETTLFAGLLIGLLGGYMMDMVLLSTFYGLSTAFVFWHIWQLRIGHPMHTGSKKPL